MIEIENACLNFISTSTSTPAHQHTSTPAHQNFSPEQTDDLSILDELEQNVILLSVGYQISSSENHKYYQQC
jgi:hypothetical protein